MVVDTDKKWSILVLLISIIVCVFVFKDAWIRPNDLSFANHYDQLKNYYTMLYYTQVQQGGLLSFTGMSYPQAEHILYTDNTPALAFLLKLFGVKNTTVGWFNSMVLLSYLLSPLVAFFLGRTLKFKPLVNVAFSFFIVWLNPQLFRLSSCSNLAMPIILLLGLYVIVKIFKDKRNTKFWYLGLFTLVYASSFIHLYYLILLSFLALPMFFVLFFHQRKAGLIGLGTVFTSVASVFLTIRLTDANYAIRPRGGMGFNYDRWRAKFESYVRSYDMLSLPALRGHKEYNPEWFAYLGSGLLLLVATYLGILFVKKYRAEIFKSSSNSHIVTALFFAGIICMFTSVGNDIFLSGKSIPNYLNPLYIASHFTEMFNNFRFLSRFSFPAFICLVTLSFYGVNRLIVSSNKYIKYIGLFIILLYTVDTVEMMNYERNDFQGQENILDEDSMTEIPDVTKSDYAAIIPIPFFYVGTEELGYIIDDENDFSSFIYQLSIKNKLPMVANKLSRTPPELGHKYLSLFQKNTDQNLLESFKGKKFLVVKSKKYNGLEMKDEPAKSISKDKNIFFEKWHPTFLFEKDEIEYHELIF